MSTNKVNVSSVLFSKVQQQLLGLLYGHPNSDFYTNEIIRFIKSGTGAVQRELVKLVDSGLITVKQVGNQKRYQANQNTPFFSELRGFIQKTFGLADILKEALLPFTKQIEIAFIYGSIAKQEDKADSDIDIMIISQQLTYSEIFQCLAIAEEKLGRKISPVLYSSSEWIRKEREENNFIAQLLRQPKIFLIGTEDELIKLGKSGKNRAIKA